MGKIKKSGLVPPRLYYSGHNVKKIGPKKSLLKICTLHTLIRCTNKEIRLSRLIIDFTENYLLRFYIHRRKIEDNRA